MPNGRIEITNRDTYKTFVPSPVEKYPMKERITHLRFKRISHDEKYEELKKKGLQIDITNPEILVNGKKPIDGIFSPMFGADTTQDTPVFTCDCHKTFGVARRGHICPYCGTEVRSIEADLRLCGYIDIAPYHIMSYHGYRAMKKVLKNLDEIITTSRRITQSGAISKSDLPTIMDLYEDYDELYVGKTGIPKKIAWMSKIPVYSSRLRPLLHNENTVGMSILDENKKYLSLVKLRGILKISQVMPNKFDRELEIQRTLNQAQQDFNEICAIVGGQTDSKDGVFRRALTSGRLDYSSRLVITLGTDLMAHEVDVPYQTMMVQYEEEIANYLSNLQDIPLHKAIAMCQANQTAPHPVFVKIINQFLRSKKGVWVLVNRNPSISEGSIIYSRIRKIHEDYTDMTLHLPQDVLGELAADFDGDQCTLVAVKDPRWHRFLLPMCPTYTFIDRADGRYNKAKGFMKDHAALLSAAWDIDTAYDRYLTSPEMEAQEIFKAMGLDNITNREAMEERDRILDLLASDKTHGPFKDRYVPKD